MVLSLCILREMCKGGWKFETKKNQKKIEPYQKKTEMIMIGGDDDDDDDVIGNNINNIIMNKIKQIDKTGCFGFGQFFHFSHHIIRKLFFLPNITHTYQRSCSSIIHTIFYWYRSIIFLSFSSFSSPFWFVCECVCVFVFMYLKKLYIIFFC